MDYVRYFVSLSNADAKTEPPRHLFTADKAAIDAFVKREDRAGRGVFSSIGLFVSGERTRNSNTVVAVPFVVVDCDLKNMAEDREAVLACLRALVAPPSWIHDSGFGLRAGWVLKEPAEGTDMVRTEKIMRGLAVLLAGDPAPTNRASLYRWPGSHNTKEGGMRLCHVLENNDAVYDVVDLEGMLDLYASRPPLLNYKEKKKANGHATDGFNFSGPVDVDNDLAMMFFGDGNAVDPHHTIHWTQLRVTGSLTRAGRPIEETVARVLARTREVAPKEKTWDWDQERIDITKMCTDLVNKSHELAYTLPDDLYKAWHAVLEKGRVPNISKNRFGLFVRSNVEGEGEAPPKVEDPTEAKADVADRLRAIGAVLHGDAPPPPQPCLFDSVLPEEGAGSIIGQPGTNKTYIGVDLAVAASAANGDTDWAGKARIKRCGAVIIEFEHSQVSQRVDAAAKHRGVTELPLPIIIFKEAKQVLQNKKITPAAISEYRERLKLAHEFFLERFGIPLGLVQVDPLIDAAGFQDENDAVEGGGAIRAFKNLGHEFHALFVIMDHAGKDLERGGRGTSAKKGKTDFEFILPEKVEDLAAHRVLQIKRLRNMPDGWGVEHWLELVEIETSDAKLATQRVVCWGQSGRNLKTETGPKASSREADALRILGERMAELDHPTGALPWVTIEGWRDECEAQMVLDDEGTDKQRDREWERIWRGLWKKRLIIVRNGRVRIPPRNEFMRRE